MAERLGIGITSIVNEDWEKENGLSVLKARDYLREPFLLLMADHLFDPSIVRKLIEFPLADGEIALGVDGNRSNPLVDLEDVTRVKTEGGKIRDIGKNMNEYNNINIKYVTFQNCEQFQLLLCSLSFLFLNEINTSF